MAPKTKAAISGFGRVLRWKDYRPLNEAPPDAPFDAATFTDIKYRTKVVHFPKGEWKLKHLSVFVIFNEKKAWVLKGKEAAELLRHEQLHYMISSIAARQLHDALANLTGQANQDPTDTCDEISARIIGRRDHPGKPDVEGLLDFVHQRYDEALLTGTKHGINRHYQILWDHKITKIHGDSHGKLEDLYFFLQPGDYEIDTRPTRTA